MRRVLFASLLGAVLGSIPGTAQDVCVHCFHFTEFKIEITGDALTIARSYLNTNPTGRARLWCADFINLVERRLGRSGTESRLAFSFLKYGRRLPGPQIGAIAVMRRRGGGHVGYVTGITPRGNPVIISGDYGRTVKEAEISSRTVAAYILPEGKTVVVRGTRPSRKRHPHPRRRRTRRHA